MYPEELIHKLEDQYDEIVSNLIELQMETTTAGLKQESGPAREHLVHGASRRLGIIRTSLENIYKNFPLRSSIPLERENLTNCEINLHAFVINVAGIFDNWVWAFVFRHGLEVRIRDRRQVGLFKPETQRYFPDQLKSYLANRITIDWHTEYFKRFRDSLAHRIPLYIPPANFTEQEAELYKQLESAKMPAIMVQNWERLEEIEKLQKTIGKPFFGFMESLNEEGASKAVYLHPQILNDALTITEFGNLFLRSWDERA